MHRDFVIDSFQELFDKTAPDFTPIYQRLRGLHDIAADTRLHEAEAIQRQSNVWRPAVCHRPYSPHPDGLSYKRRR